MMKSRSFLRLSTLSCLLFVFLCEIGRSACAQYANTNGIFAEFNTSMGSYTCRLDYAVAPKAVANFIGLATGQRPWLDVSTGQIRTDAFYNGTIFHRVITNFMNQGGSRNGIGTDGPGWQFVDEFSLSARHDAFGVLSMANSGPDSNGSQFFITVGPHPHLNDGYTVFGRLFGGSNVVYAINRVATANDRPLTNVILNSVVIQRIGTAAQNFNIHAQGLPVVTNLNLGIARNGATLSLTFSNRLDVENRFYSSTNLQNWSSAGSFGFETSLPLWSSANASAARTSEFFRAVQVQYPTTLYVPRSVANRPLTLNFSNGLIFWLTLNSLGGGSYTNNAGVSGGVNYIWRQDPYRGRFDPIGFDGYGYLQLHLDFDSATNGTFKGSAAGTFTILN